jgi:hypothetical protein
MENGGLGIHDLQRFGHATPFTYAGILYAWQNPDKAWVGSMQPCDEGDFALFKVITSTITVLENLSGF